MAQRVSGEVHTAPTLAEWKAYWTERIRSYRAVQSDSNFLSADEAITLMLAFRMCPDPTFADNMWRILQCNFRNFCHHIGYKLALGRGIPKDEIRSVLNMGLLVACQKFNPGRSLAIKQVIKWYVLDQVTDAAEKGCWRGAGFSDDIESAIAKLHKGALEETDLEQNTQKALAVRKALQRSRSLNHPVDDGSGDSTVFEELVADPRVLHPDHVVFRGEQRALLDIAMHELSAQHREAVQAVFMHEYVEKDGPLSYKEVGRKLGITGEAIRQRLHGTRPTATGPGKVGALERMRECILAHLEYEGVSVEEVVEGCA